MNHPKKKLIKRPIYLEDGFYIKLNNEFKKVEVIDFSQFNFLKDIEIRVLKGSLNLKELQELGRTSPKIRWVDKELKVCVESDSYVYKTIDCELYMDITLEIKNWEKSR